MSCSVEQSMDIDATIRELRESYSRNSGNTAPLSSMPESKSSDRHYEDTDDQPKKKRRRRAARQEVSAFDLLIYPPSSHTEYMPEDAAQCRNVDSMVRMACINLRNINNLPIMEWSEAIMLQLCTLKIELNLKLVDWSAACNILKAQWSHEVVSSLRKHSGTLDPLSDIIAKNHQLKIRMSLVRPDEMFRDIPKINYELLRTFCVEPLSTMLAPPPINMRQRSKS